MDQAPFAELKNGLRVANFSSPHAFTFCDGTVLAACSESRSRALMLLTDEVHNLEPKRRFMEVRMRFIMSDVVKRELLAMHALERHHDEFEALGVPLYDIILVPLPVLLLVRENRAQFPRSYGIRTKDRVKKIIHDEYFCV